MEILCRLRQLKGAARHRFAWQAGVLAGLVLAVLLTAAFWRYNALCDAVCADTLRLHVLANSDSAADQALKLQVRDAVLAEAAPVLAGAAGRTEAEQRLRDALPRLRAAALRTVRAAGSGQAVAVRLEQRRFDAKDYGDFALPAGRYTALRVELGRAEGHNWFCVLYPELCLGAAGAQYDTPAENALVFGRYEVRFAALDAARSLWQRWNEAAPPTAPSS